MEKVVSAKEYFRAQMAIFVIRNNFEVMKTITFSCQNYFSINFRKQENCIMFGAEK